MATALLIIDMQRALCTGEEAAFGIDGVLQRINAISTRARAAGVPVTLMADAHSTIANGGRSAAEISAEHNRTLAAMAGPAAHIAVKPAAAVSLR